MADIGFIGLGSMGAPIAARLLPGNRVCGTNRSPAKAGALVEQGMIWRDTPREAAEAARLVFSMVADDAALAAVTEGPDGILAGLRPGAIYIDMSTVGPGTSQELAARVGRLGAAMLDAPVSGSVPAAEAGTPAIMVGGPAETYLAASALLHRLGADVTHVGGNGRGLLLKLAINISLAAQMLAFSEGLLPAQRGGIEPELAARVMTSSAIGSPMLQARAALALDPPARAWFDMRLMHKDIRLALRAAQDAHVPLPAAAVADQVLEQATDLGYGASDIAALYQVLARTPTRPTADGAARQAHAG
jgi:3-hydroxyisobutyrate dehydrogenase-like beta-hydroxyacid dehydrogenase